MKADDRDIESIDWMASNPLRMSAVLRLGLPLNDDDMIGVKHKHGDYGRPWSSDPSV